MERADGATAPRWKAGARSRQGAAFVLPLFLFMLVAFTAPVLLMLGWSVTNPTPTARHYAYLLETPVYLKVLANTLRIALITTA
ncbi:MAG: ABC transporter permease, partial [Anaerolineales bacterium]